MTPFPYNLGLKAPSPNRKDARFTFHTLSAVQSALQTFLFIGVADCFMVEMTETV